MSDAGKAQGQGAGQTGPAEGLPDKMGREHVSPAQAKLLPKPRLQFDHALTLTTRKHGDWCPEDVTGLVQGTGSSAEQGKRYGAGEGAGGSMIRRLKMWPFFVSC